MTGGVPWAILPNSLNSQNRCPHGALWPHDPGGRTDPNPDVFYPKLMIQDPAGNSGEWEILAQVPEKAEENQLEPGETMENRELKGFCLKMKT